MDFVVRSRARELLEKGIARAVLLGDAYIRDAVRRAVHAGFRLRRGGGGGGGLPAAASLSYSYRWTICREATCHAGRPAGCT